MGYRTIYTDLDGFNGAASADMAGRMTANGNVWLRVTGGGLGGKIGLDGADRAHYTGGPSGALYGVRMDDAAFLALTLEQQKHMHVSVTLEATATAAHVFMMASVAGMPFRLGLLATGAIAGVVTSTWPGASNSVQEIPAQFLFQGAFDPSTNPNGEWGSIESDNVAPTVGQRIDPYQIVTRVSSPSRGNQRLQPDPQLLRTLPSQENTYLTYGLALFDTVLDANRARALTIRMAIYETTPRILSPQWQNYGSRAVARVENLDFGGGFCPVSVLDPIDETAPLGDYIINLPQVDSDRGVSPKMTQVINRRNPAPVDLLIGPYAWRIGAGSDAEIPIPEGIPTTHLTLRGGGAGTVLLVYGEQVPKTFRQ